MAARPPFELTLDQRQIVAVGKALKSEADGKLLRRELLKDIKAAGGPLVSDLKQSALLIPSEGIGGRGQALRPAIANAIKPAVRLTGERTGLTIRAAQTPNVRGFKLAARRMNRQSFRHRVFGRDVWVDQTGDEGWFDDTVKGRREEIKRAVMHSVEKTVHLLAERTKGSIK